MSTSDLDGLPLAPLMNTLRGDVSFDALSKAVGEEVGSQTLQRMADPQRPYKVPVAVESLIGAANAINRGTPNRTTPWALWVAHGISFEDRGLWGRPSRSTVDAISLLVPGWETLVAPRLAAWNRTGAALLAEQGADQQASRDAETIASLRARVEELEAEAAKATTPRTRKRP